MQRNVVELKAVVILITVFLHQPTQALTLSSEDYGEQVEECRERLRTNDPGATSLCDQLLERSEVSRRGKTRIQLDYASRAITRGDFTAAESYLDDALLDNDALRQKNIYRYHWLRMKALIQYKQDRYELAVPYMQEALSVALAIGRTQSIATSFNDLGSVFLETGAYGDALANLQRALQELEKLDNGYSTGLTLANIANVYRDLEDLESSVDYLERAARSHRTHLEKNPDDAYGVRALAQVMEDMGITYTGLGEYSLAREALADAYDTFRRFELTPDQIRVLAATADVELASGNGRAALSLLEQALVLERDIPPKRSIEVRRGLVSAHMQQGNLADARIEASVGLEIAGESGRLPEELFFLEALIDIAIAQKDQQGAMDYQQRYFAKYQLSLEERYKTQIAELQSTIEVRQQAQSINALKTERSDLQRAVKLQRWLIIGAGVIVCLLLLIIALIYRQRNVKREYLNREIALHRQEFETDPAESVEKAEVVISEQEGPKNNSASEEEKIDNASALAIALVTLMRSCVEIWERTSGQTRVELAEKSKAWQVTIDNGRLRTRTMDRYCDLKKLPKVPRWRQVVRTCRYILINCELSDAQRQRLNDELEIVFQVQRQLALAGEQAERTS